MEMEKRNLKMKVTELVISSRNTPRHSILSGMLCTSDIHLEAGKLALAVHQRGAGKGHPKLQMLVTHREL